MAGSRSKVESGNLKAEIPVGPRTTDQRTTDHGTRTLSGGWTRDTVTKAIFTGVFTSSTRDMTRDMG